MIHSDWVGFDRRLLLLAGVMILSKSLFPFRPGLDVPTQTMITKLAQVKSCVSLYHHPCCSHFGMQATISF